MNPQDKLKMFTQVRFDCHMADAWAQEIAHSGTITVEQSSELLRRATKANASAQAFERAMRGVEPPKAGG